MSTNGPGNPLEGGKVMNLSEGSIISKSSSSTTTTTTTTTRHQDNTIEEIPPSEMNRDNTNLDDAIRLALNDPDFPINRTKNFSCNGCLPVKPTTSEESVSCEINNSSDSDDDDDEAYRSTSMGYMPLPQDPALDEQWNGDDDDGDDDDDIHGYVNDSLQVEGHEDIDQQRRDLEGAGVCGGGAHSPAGACASATSKLKEDEVGIIKKAMSGFSLPLSAVPEWARHVPEDVWKFELLDGLHGKSESKRKKKKI